MLLFKPLVHTLLQPFVPALPKTSPLLPGPPPLTSSVIKPIESVVAGTTISFGAHHRVRMPERLTGKAPRRETASSCRARLEEELEKRAMLDALEHFMSEDRDIKLVLAPHPREVLGDNEEDGEDDNEDEEPMAHSREGSVDSLATIRPTRQRSAPAAHELFSSTPTLTSIPSAPDWDVASTPSAPITLATAPCADARTSSRHAGEAVGEAYRPSDTAIVTLIAASTGAAKKAGVTELSTKASKVSERKAPQMQRLPIVIAPVVTCHVSRSTVGMGYRSPKDPNLSGGASERLERILKAAEPRDAAGVPIVPGVAWSSLSLRSVDYFSI